MKPTDRDDLHAAVLADPADLELRRVYADRLIELGDPWGELIILQDRRLAGAGSEAALARERELLARHALDRLGPLGAVVHEAFEIERGFLRACVVPSHRRPYNVERVAGDPRWATVEILEGPAPIYLHPVMRALRVLKPSGDGLPDGLVELCAGPVARPIERLDVGYWYVGTKATDAFLVASALPNLVELACRCTDLHQLGVVLAAPVTARLERLVLDIGSDLHPPLVEWLRALNSSAPVRVRSVRLGTVQRSPVSYELRRGVAGFDHLVLTLGARTHAAWVTRVIGHVAGLVDLVRRIDVIERGTSTAPGKLRSLLELVERFAEHSFVTVDD